MSDRVSSLAVRFTWSRADFVRGLRRSIRLRGPILYILVGTGLAVLTGSPTTWLTVTLIWATFVLTLVYVVVPYRMWFKIVDAQEQRTTTFSDEGISIVGDSVSSELEWPYFSRAVESKHFIYLIRKNQRLGLLIPKSVLGSQADVDELRSIIGEHLSVGKRRLKL